MLTGTAIARSNGAVLIKNGALLLGCCCEPACDGISAITGPFGCPACLCSATTSFWLCVDNETESELNTANEPVVLTGSAGSYVYEEAGIRKFTIDLTDGGTANINEYQIRSYIWSGGVWVLHRDSGVVDGLDAGQCLGFQDFGGPTYFFRARSNWVNGSTLAVTFAGLTYVNDGSCVQDNHQSGTLNGVTYSKAPGSAWPESDGCSWGAPEIDADVLSNAGQCRIMVSCSGSRTWQVAAYPGNGTLGYYFTGSFNLASGQSCLDTFVINNDLTAACQAFGGAKAIGYGGTATVTFS